MLPIHPELSTPSKMDILTNICVATFSKAPTLINRYHQPNESWSEE